MHEIIDSILDSKVLAILVLLFAIVMFIHSMVRPSTGVLAITILSMSYFGLIGLPALMKKSYIKD